MTIPQTRYAKTGSGLRIAYQQWGSGPPCLIAPALISNVEIMWELEPLADLFERLSSFSRLILHDRRGTGLSGGSSFPNLETRARDLLTVLDTIRSSRAALRPSERKSRPCEWSDATCSWLSCSRPTNPSGC